MLTNDEMKQAQEYLSGTCESESVSLSTCLDRSYTEQEFEQYIEYLAKKEVFACENCGWWVYPGEGYDTFCDECKDDNMW